LANEANFPLRSILVIRARAKIFNKIIPKFQLLTTRVSGIPPQIAPTVTLAASEGEGEMRLCDWLKMRATSDWLQVNVEINAFANRGGVSTKKKCVAIHRQTNLNLFMFMHWK